MCVQAYEITVKTQGLLVTLCALKNMNSVQKQHITLNSLNWGVLSFMALVHLDLKKSLLTPLEVRVCDVGRWL